LICEGVEKFSHDFTICGKRISLTKKFVNNSQQENVPSWTCNLIW